MGTEAFLARVDIQELFSIRKTRAGLYEGLRPWFHDGNVNSDGSKILPVEAELFGYLIGGMVYYGSWDKSVDLIDMARRCTDAIHEWADGHSVRMILDSHDDYALNFPVTGDCYFAS